MQEQRPDSALARSMQAEYDARQRASHAYEANRHERRADAAIARRAQEKQARVREQVALVFYSRASTADVIAGWPRRRLGLGATADTPSRVAVLLGPAAIHADVDRRGRGASNFHSFG